MGLINHYMTASLMASLEAREASEPETAMNIISDKTCKTCSKNDYCIFHPVTRKRIKPKSKACYLYSLKDK